MRQINTGLHYPINMSALPSIWSAGFVGEFCQEVQSGFACGQHSDKNIGIPHLRPMNISREGSLDFDVIKYVSSGYDARRLAENDVLFNNTNSPELIGKTAYINNKGDGLAFSNHMTRLRFHPVVLPKFGAFQLHFLWMARYFLHRCVKHVNQASISAGELAKSIPFVAPPLSEQHRIVAKIEELFSELDKGIENLETARAQLKVYRQALLKHAFEGKLTAKWREENKDKLETATALLKRIQLERAQRYQQQLADWEAGGKQGSKSKTLKSRLSLTAEEVAELFDLPDGWGWEKLGNIADLIGGVTKGKNLKGKEKLSLPYLRVANVQDGYLDLREIKYIEVETLDKAKYRLEFGDVLYTEGGDKDKLGRGAVWRNQIDSCIHQNHIFRARIFDGLISPKILSLYSQTKSARKYFFRHAKQTTNLASINLTVLANLPVTIFSQREQQQILLETESRLSECDQLDQTITTSLQQAEALRQSILKKAFSGQLVPQDPHDEPASALLARIKTEKSTKSHSRKVRT